LVTASRLIASGVAERASPFIWYRHPSQKLGF
jgi:hypothetical protein